MKNAKHQPPTWLDPLETTSQKVIFRYELARRTMKGRRRNLPQWNQLSLGVRLALDTLLSTESRPAWSLETGNGYAALTLRIETPPVINNLHDLEIASSQHSSIVLRETLHLDLYQPDSVLLRVVKAVLHSLREEHGIRPHTAPTDTRGTPWGWLNILDNPRGLNDSDRALLAKARQRGKQDIPTVLLCFANPTEIILQNDTQLFRKPK